MENKRTLKFRKALDDMLDCVIDAMTKKETTAQEPEEEQWPGESFTAEDVICKLRERLEAAVDEGRENGYDRDFDKKASPQTNFDRGQFRAYKKIADHLDVLVGQID